MRVKYNQLRNTIRYVFRDTNYAAEGADLSFRIVSDGVSLTIAALASHKPDAMTGSYESFDYGMSRVPWKYFPEMRSNLGSITMFASDLPERATLFTLGTNGRRIGNTKRHANLASLP